jgi:hypothetical protein
MYPYWVEVNSVVAILGLSVAVEEMMYALFVLLGELGDRFAVMVPLRTTKFPFPELSCVKFPLPSSKCHAADMLLFIAIGPQSQWKRLASAAISSADFALE